MKRQLNVRSAWPVSPGLLRGPRVFINRTPYQGGPHERIVSCPTSTCLNVNRSRALTSNETRENDKGGETCPADGKTRDYLRDPLNTRDKRLRACQGRAYVLRIVIYRRILTTKQLVTVYKGSTLPEKSRLPVFRGQPARP